MTDANNKLPAKESEKSVQQDNPWSPFVTLRTEIDRLFDSFLPSSWRPLERSVLASGLPSLSGWAVAPAVDVVEKESTFEISAELAGMDEKDIDVKLSNGFLTIRGEKQEEREDKQKEYHVSERRYGSFQRTFKLPEGVDADKVEATFKKGILRIILPKNAEAKKNERKINIKAS
ncbi:Hsp20/alpha crystallin family protein [Pseudorhizobium halotolerans]|uniref:Hsp20/alpha crystallin family protein n=1 Tax=Pseudorhizobium halotolerans TaxID=1233081 RepID=A0ABN7JF58_9HYPH|nr:Hsp20/alpha crystallin family protein [Pseudorhizobium halotolerans]CAD7023678.1 Hsp20/alpha crystallin family protein [Pseudorhizobium halotolerans]